MDNYHFKEHRREKVTQSTTVSIVMNKKTNCNI